MQGKIVLPPLDVSCVCLYLLAAPDPCCHLGVFVFPICCTICLLDAIDLEALGLLRVVVISSTKKTDGVAVMKKAMQFWDVELGAYTKVEEDIFITVEI